MDVMVTKSEVKVLAKFARRLEPVKVLIRGNDDSGIGTFCDIGSKGKKSPSCKSRKSFICDDGLRSPISSRKSVPPDAFSMRPLRA